MRIAAIYDIHGNLPALEAVLSDIEKARPDLILVGGDIVTGPMPRATLEYLQGLGKKVRFIRGNADREVVEVSVGNLNAHLPEELREVTNWVAAQLGQDQIDFLAQLPEQLILPVDGLEDVLFCHGSPCSDVEIITAATPETRLYSMLKGVRQHIVVCGHTHMQFDRVVMDKRIVNAGSVGMPYGEPGAYWLLLGPHVILQRTPYDLEQAAAHICASGYPQAQDFAENNVLNPPTQAEAIAVFEQMTP